MKGKFSVLLVGALYGAVIGGFVSFFFLNDAVSKIGLDFLERRTSLSNFPDQVRESLINLHSAQKSSLFSTIFLTLAPYGALVGALLAFTATLFRNGNKRNAWVDIFILIPVVQVLCTFALWQALPKFSAQFLAVRWKTDVFSRREMINDLTEHYQLKNKDRESLEALLGPGDSAMFKGEESLKPAPLVYQLGLGDSLEFKFLDESNRVKDWRIRHLSRAGKDVIENIPVPTLINENGKSFNKTYMTMDEIDAVVFDGKKLNSTSSQQRAPLERLKGRYGYGDNELNLPVVGTVNPSSVLALKDGRIFVIGSVANTRGQRNLIWLIDLKKDSIAEGPKLVPPRSGESVVPLRDGRILIAGGSDRTEVEHRVAFEPLALCQIYDPVKNTLSHAGNMIVPRSGAGIALLNNGDVLIAGGTTKAGYADKQVDRTSTAELFSVAQGSKHTFIGATESEGGNTAVVPYKNNQALIISEERNRGGYNYVTGNSAAIFKGFPASQGSALPEISTQQKSP